MPQTHSTPPGTFALRRPPGATYAPPAAPGTPFPIVLQRRARQAVRRHLKNAVVRTALLLMADGLLLVALKYCLRILRDDAWFGERVANVAGVIMPHGLHRPGEFVLALVVGLVAFRTYGAGDRRRDPSALLSGVTLGLALLFWKRFWLLPSAATLIGLGLSFVVIGPALVIERLLVDRIVRHFRWEGRHAARALIVGRSADVQRAMRQPPLNDQSEFIVTGFVDPDPQPSIAALGGVSELITVIERQEVDTVILCGHFDDDLFADLLDLSHTAGCLVLSMPRSLKVGEFEPELVWRRGAPMVQLTQPGLRGRQLVVKRALDLAISLAGLVVLAPLFVVIAAAIMVTSRGPIFYRQLRVGIGGRRFHITKFRSMCVGADERQSELADQSVYRDGRLFKLTDDPRVTRLGRFLRRSSLDELPQLWDVLRGRMSLVGPRPPMPSEVALYEEHHYTRFVMRPGITGPWQVGGRNRITDFEAVVRLETNYMRHWSIWHDLEILVRTVPAVLRMDGAH
jgi:exopolysaccharide biosynthesis polyprenyl glycosylphosphotransferase